jgi:hypothetical protein
VTAEVRLDVDTARTLARACVYAEVVPGLALAWERLRDAIDSAELHGELEDLTPPPPRAVSTPRPRWDYLRAATSTIRRTLDEDPASLAVADALGGYVRDTFDALGLSVWDEQTLYVALTTASLETEMARNGQDRGLIAAETVAAVAKIGQSLAGALLPYLPPEAK